MGKYRLKGVIFAVVMLPFILLGVIGTLIYVAIGIGREFVLDALR